MRETGVEDAGAMIVTKGFSDRDRSRIAALYWGAFGPKLNFAMGPRDKALAYFERVMSPEHAYCARDPDGTLLGVAGFKTAEGALVGGTFRDMAQVYGIAGAAWRVLVLSALERDVENLRFLMDGIFVEPAAQGRGVGSCLLEAIAQEAAARGYEEVRLDVIDSNARARALYERRGYRAVGHHATGPLSRHVFGFRSATTMVRRLQP
jgi:ribosomal protein S18 acetylase RimI-like enzyme